MTAPTTPPLPPPPPPGPWTGPPPGSAPAPAPGGSTLATIALILAAIPTVVSQVAALVMAIIVLGEGRRGRARAVAALVVASAWILVGAVLLAVSMSGASLTRDASGAVIDGRRVSADLLKVGDCGEDITDGGSFTVLLIPCDQPHRSEVFREFDLTFSQEVPSQGEIDDRAVTGCLAQYESFVGIPYEDSTLEFFYFSPTPDTWRYDRRAICVLVTAQDQVGSLEGSAL